MTRSTRWSCCYIKKVEDVLQNIKEKAEAYATSDGVGSTSRGALEDGAALDNAGTRRIRDTRF
jgi:hypothetical protein